MLIKIIISLVLGYVFGLFQTGYVYGKLFHGIDIREYGSHSSGATNTVRTLGKHAGIIVFAGDAIKAIVAVCIIRFLIFPAQEHTLLFCMLCGLGVIIGHDFPFYLGFHGGKGISATGGLMFALHPLMGILGGAVYLVVFLSTRYSSVASLAVSVLFPVLSLFFFKGQWIIFILSVLICLVNCWQHRENIKRLLSGKENRFEKKK